MDPIIYDIYPLGHSFGSAVSSKTLFVRRPKKLFTYYCLVASVWLTSTEEPTASGWSQLPSTPATSGGITLRRYTRIVSAADPFVYEWRLTDNKADWYCVIESYHGVDITTPVSFSHSQAQSSPSATLPTGSITTTTDKCLVVASYFSYGDHEILPASGFRETAQKSFTTRRVQLSAQRQSDAGLVQAIASFKEGTAASLNNIAALNPLVIEEKTKDIYPPSVEGYWHLGLDGYHWTDHPGGLVTSDGWYCIPGDPTHHVYPSYNRVYMEFDLSDAIDVPSPWSLKLTEAFLKIGITPGLGNVQDSCSPSDDPSCGFIAKAQGTGAAIGLSGAERVWQHENGTRKVYGISGKGIIEVLNTPLGPLKITMESEGCDCTPQPPLYGAVNKLIGWSGTASGIGGPTLELRYALVPPYLPLKDGGYGDLPPLLLKRPRLWFSNRSDGTLTIGYDNGIVKYPNLEGDHRFEEKVSLDGSSTSVGQAVRLLLNLNTLHDISTPWVAFEFILEYLAEAIGGNADIEVELLLDPHGTAIKTYTLSAARRSAELLAPRVGRLSEMLIQFWLRGENTLGVSELKVKELTMGAAKTALIGTK
jgi:hypothetical protein